MRHLYQGYLARILVCMANIEETAGHVRSQESIVEQQFGPRAASYLSSAVHSLGEDLAALADIVGARPNAAALDLGCGAGHAAFLMAPVVKSVIAYDLSAGMVA